MISLAQLARPFLENSTQGSPSSTTSSHLLDYLVIPCLMSQSTYREHDVRSTLSYQERETALFGESSSGSDYDIEEALSQPTTDDGSVDLVRTRTIPHCQGAVCSSPRCNSPESGPWQHLESPKYFKLLFPWAKLTAHHTNFK